MTTIAFQTLTGAPIGAPIVLRARKRNLARLVRRHVRLDVPFLVSVHANGDAIALHDDAVRVPLANAEGVPTWGETVVGRSDTVLITVIPQGGNNAAGKIASIVGMIALAAFAPWAAGLITGATAGFAYNLVAGGIMLGGAALIAAINRPKSQNNKPLYGVSGGGTAARPNERIPVGYGEFWTTPDLSQPDYFLYEGDDQVLMTRRTIGQGKYDLLAIRVGTTTIWTAAGGFVPNFAGQARREGQAGFFNDPGSSWGGAARPGAELEVLFGTISNLVPQDVVSSASVTGVELPYSTSVSPWSGLFAVSAVGVDVGTIQIDWSYPQGYQRSNGQATAIALTFEIAPIDNSGNPTGPFVNLIAPITGSVKTAKAKRFSRIINLSDIGLPRGRYAVRARNNVPELDGHTRSVSWDGLRGYIANTVARPNITEIAMRIRSGKGLQITSFQDIQVKVRRVGQVWNGTAFVEAPLRYCGDIYVDILTNTDYGAALPTSQVDLAKVLAYKTAAAPYNTFDGMINGPVPVREAMATVLANMRAEPIRLGAGWGFNRDEPSAFRRHTFSRRQIVRGSTKLTYKTDTEDGSADYIVDFFSDADPKRANSAQATYGTPSINPKRVSWQGVSTYEHAVHLARWFAAASFYRRKEVEFGTELDGRLITRGDIAAIDAWFETNRRSAGMVALSGNTLTLDVDVTIGANDWVTIRDRGGQEWGPVRVTQGAGPRLIVLNSSDVTAEAAATGVALASLFHDDGDPPAVLIGDLTPLGQQWLINSVSPRSGNEYTISARIDAPEVYDAIGATIPPDSSLTWNLVARVAPDITFVRGRVIQHTSSLEIEWAVAAQPGAVRFEISLSYDNGTTWEEIYDGPNTAGSSPVRYAPEQPVLVRAVAYGETGVAGVPMISQAITTPRPMIPATSVDEGAIFWQQQAETLRRTWIEAEQRQAALLAQVDELASQVAQIANSQIAIGTRQERRLAYQAGDLLAAITRVDQVGEDAAGALQAVATTTTEVVNARNGASTLLARTQAMDLARADGDSALAARLSVAETALGGSEAMARFLLSTTATGASASAIIDFFVKANASATARAAGLQLWATATDSGVYIRADKTAILTASGTPIAVFDGTTGKVLANAILANSLSALSGTIGYIQTAPSGARVEISDRGVRVFDSAGVLRSLDGDLTWTSPGP